MDAPAAPFNEPMPSDAMSAEDASLIARGAWLNDLARESFLHDQGHPEMFFFVTASDEVFGMQFPEGVDPAQRNALVQAEAARVRPCGTVYTRIGTAVALPGLKFPFGDGTAPTARCLIVELESESGLSRSWVSAIVETETGLELEPAVVLDGKGKTGA